ncbi:tail fiber domain-containing protein [Pantoea agglomerans]
MMKASKAIILPDGFEWKLSATLMCPQNHMPNEIRISISCPDGRAKITMSSAGLMLDQNNTYKFEKAFFENIDFVGFDKQNTASQFMSAPEGRWCANFITQNCSWDGFHTYFRASLIFTKHYNAKHYGCGDTGVVVYTDHWSVSKFSVFNLNEWHNPIFSGKYGRIFQILGGFNNYIYGPWFERVETVASAMFVNQSHYNFQVIDSWLENFKSQFFMHFDGDGTENTQSDIIIIDGMHINNNWSLDPDHSAQASGFTALINRINPANPGNNYDTKLCFRNIYEHQSSVTGWALTRTGSTLNLATSIHELSNCRLRPGQPNLSDGMTLIGSLPDLRRHYRDLSSNKFDLVPGNFQLISGRNTTGSQKDLVFDNSGDSAYFRRSNSVKLIEWTTNYFAPGTANAIQCGTTTRLWSGGFTQTAFTVTSDERHKIGITPFTVEGNDRKIEMPDDGFDEIEALLDAWGEVDYAMYQFKDMAEEKGVDKARWHFGVVAQRVFEALTRHGLQWDKYAFICYDEWGARDNQYDDNGNLMEPAREAGSKYGIRYEEALVLEASYIRRKLRQLEKLTRSLRCDTLSR